MMKTVLIFGNSCSIRRMLGFALQQLGVLVLQAEDEAEAIRMASEQPIDLLILEREIPEFHGLADALRFRRKLAGSEPPVILLGDEPKPVGGDLEEDLKDCFYVRKPFKMKDVSELVRAALG